jgi:deazaflavin-dependent oxidoreductase (nitroreductase family)
MNDNYLVRLPYPAGLVRWLFKAPILLYRLGLGFLVGRILMIMTTTGRKSGLPRQTAIEFHEFRGRRYVLSAWGTKTDWYRNIEKNPLITIQTWRGVENVRARRVTADEELAAAYEYARSNPLLNMMMKRAGFDLTGEQFVAQKRRFVLVTFDPAGQPPDRQFQ